MSKKPTSDAENPELIRATNQGRIDTQAQRHAQKPHKDNAADQSEGAKAGGQPTGMHGRGAGFGRERG